MEGQRCPKSLTSAENELIRHGEHDAPRQKRRGHSGHCAGPRRNAPNHAAQRRKRRHGHKRVIIKQLSAPLFVAVPSPGRVLGEKSSDAPADRLGPLSDVPAASLLGEPDRVRPGPTERSPARTMERRGPKVRDPATAGPRTNNYWVIMARGTRAGRDRDQIETLAGAAAAAAAEGVVAVCHLGNSGRGDGVMRWTSLVIRHAWLYGRYTCRLEGHAWLLLCCSAVKSNQARCQQIMLHLMRRKVGNNRDLGFRNLFNYASGYADKMLLLLKSQHLPLLFVKCQLTALRELKKYFIQPVSYKTTICSLCFVVHKDFKEQNVLF